MCEKLLRHCIFKIYGAYPTVAFSNILSSYSIPILVGTYPIVPTAAPIRLLLNNLLEMAQVLFMLYDCQSTYEKFLH